MVVRVAHQRRAHVELRDAAEAALEDLDGVGHALAMQG